MASKSSTQSKIREELISQNLIADGRLELFSKGTRDNESISVFRDKQSSLIFHDFYHGDEFY